MAYFAPAELLTPTVDKSQVPPLHQKRIVAFVNHFLISSCNFLNEFATNCESKFVALERKIQRLEAGLTIIEAKLASIPADTFVTKTDAGERLVENPVDNATASATTPQDEVGTESEAPTPPIPTEALVRACEDVRYKKYFKMLKVGVLPNAVKIKMQAEGVDPSILDTPNLELPDGVKS